MFSHCQNQGWKWTIFYISLWSLIYSYFIQCRDSRTEYPTKVEDKHILEKQEELPLFLYTQKPYADNNVKPTSVTTLNKHNNVTMGTTLCSSNTKSIIFCSSTKLSFYLHLWHNLISILKLQWYLFGMVCQS